MNKGFDRICFEHEVKTGLNMFTVYGLKYLEIFFCYIRELFPDRSKEFSI